MYPTWDYGLTLRWGGWSNKRTLRLSNFHFPLMSRKYRAGKRSQRIGSSHVKGAKDMGGNGGAVGEGNQILHHPRPSRKKGNVPEGERFFKEQAVNTRKVVSKLWGSGGSR